MAASCLALLAVVTVVARVNNETAFKLAQAHAVADHMFMRLENISLSVGNVDNCSRGVDVPTYWINLDTSIDRRKFFLKSLRRSGITTPMERVPAVRGGRYWRNPVKSSGFAWRSKGELGCALSHLKVARRLLDDGHDAALVLEDDADLTFWRLWPYSLRQIINKLPPNWTTLSLQHWLNESTFRESTNRLVLESGASAPVNKSAFIVNTEYTEEVWGTTAYLMSRRWAARLCSYTLGCTALHRNRIPIDTHKTGADHLLYRMNGHVTFVLWPQYIVVSSPTRKSFSTITKQLHRAARDRQKILQLALDNSAHLIRLLQDNAGAGTAAAVPPLMVFSGGNTCFKPHAAALSNSTPAPMRFLLLIRQLRYPRCSNHNCTREKNWRVFRSSARTCHAPQRPPSGWY